MTENIAPAFDRLSVPRIINMRDGEHRLRFTATATGEVSDAGMWRIRFDDVTYGEMGWVDPYTVSYIPGGGIRVCTFAVDDKDMEVFTATAVNVARWNGFASPWFTRAEMQRIADHNQKLADTGEYGSDAFEAIRYDADRDVFTITSDYGDGPETNDCVFADFAGTRLHSISGWSWAEAEQYGY